MLHPSQNTRQSSYRQDVTLRMPANGRAFTPAEQKAMVAAEVQSLAAREDTVPVTNTEKRTHLNVLRDLGIEFNPFTDPGIAFQEAHAKSLEEYWLAQLGLEGDALRPWEDNTTSRDPSVPVPTQTARRFVQWYRANVQGKIVTRAADNFAELARYLNLNIIVVGQGRNGQVYNTVYLGAAANAPTVVLENKNAGHFTVQGDNTRVSADGYRCAFHALLQALAVPAARELAPAREAAEAHRRSIAANTAVANVADFGFADLAAEQEKLFAATGNSAARINHETEGERAWNKYMDSLDDAERAAREEQERVNLAAAFKWAYENPEDACSQEEEARATRHNGL